MYFLTIKHYRYTQLVFKQKQFTWLIDKFLSKCIISDPLFSLTEWGIYLITVVAFVVIILISHCIRSYIQTHTSITDTADVRVPFNIQAEEINYYKGLHVYDEAIEMTDTMGDK